MVKCLSKNMELPITKSMTVVTEKMATKLTERFEKAVVYAIQLHSLQVRKQTEIPYISHLLTVASLVLEDGGDEDEAIAALLHDAIEDQGGLETREVILKYFGERVTNIVAVSYTHLTLPTKA